MLEYIKSQIKSQRSEQVAKQETPADVSNEVIVEYAHLFQELAEDISENGTESGKTRKLGIDIPLDLDTEVSSIELNLDGALVEDVPGDATSITESYQTMKTYDKFYEEAVRSTTRFPRETEDAYDSRVTRIADKMYNEYCAEAAKIGDFGCERISVTDDKVPSKLNVDFGPMEEGSNKSFVSKVKTFFSIDNDNTISKKQLDSINLIKNGAFTRIGQPLMAYMESNYDVPVNSSVWDVCTPTKIIIPAGNHDSFCVVLEYTNELTGKEEYFGWTAPVVQEETMDDNKMNADIKVNMEAFVNEERYRNKDTVIQEMAYLEQIKRNKKKAPLSRFYQESDEVVEEAVGLGQLTNLRGQVENEIGDKFDVSDVTTRMGIGSCFDIKRKGSDFLDEAILTVSGNNNNSCKISGRNLIPAIIASLAFVPAKIKELLSSPEIVAVESATYKRNRNGRFYQEAIDMGDATTSTDANAGTDAPAAPTDQPAADTTQPTDQAADANDKETAAVNDVSSQIAEKVADETNQQTNAPTDTADTGDSGNSGDVTFPDEGSNMDNNFDNDSMDQDMGSSIDDQLNDLDATNAEGEIESSDMDGMDDTDTEGMDADVDADIENMSMEDIMNNASEKLKSMPLSELKAFLQDNTAGEFQEAFILTKKNINKEVDVRIRKCLAILNNKDMPFEKIAKKFKFEGHSLNRVLVKAAKTPAVYSSNEQEELKKLNTLLADVMTSLKKSNDSSYVTSVKRKIEAFTKQVNVVTSFVEDKMGVKPVQEAFLLGNIKGKLTDALISVKDNMSEIKKLHDSGKLSRGRIIKKYAAISTGLPPGANVDLVPSNMPSHVGHTILKGYSDYAVNIDKALKLLNKALRKKDIDNKELINELADKIDVISDYIETVIDDKIENKERINQIGILAGEIIDLINRYIDGDDSVADTDNTPVDDTSDEFDDTDTSNDSDDDFDNDSEEDDE